MITVTGRQVAPAADLLARAFFNDPLFAYFFPDEAHRLRRSAHTFRFLVRHALGKGRVRATSERLEGVIIYFHSSRMRKSLADQLRLGGPAMLVCQGLSAISRQIAADDYMTALHGRHVADPHTYLAVLGVDPAFQGKGLGARLVACMLGDREAGSACYLHTHRRRNLDFYRRFGFELVEESVIPRSGVINWSLMRPPRVTPRSSPRARP
jgi:ribosomal protein S18 acetylase RimI-like enzyme